MPFHTVNIPVAGVNGTHNRAGAGTGNHVDGDAFPVQDGNNADMSQATGGAAAQSQTDFLPICIWGVHDYSQSSSMSFSACAVV
jgi:hypothetical protein